MADGGLRDQLGGGFHRYSTDARWLVPHFEQMLYDNAQLARVYVHAWALTGDARYRAVATGTLDYMLRELTTDDGAFAASQDADTDGIEGLTFTWRAPEIRDVLGDDAALFAAAYGVTDEGNWEGVTILSRVVADDALAERFGRPATEVADAARRRPRAPPARVGPSGPSRLGTARRSRPGTVWRSRLSRKPPWRSRRPTLTPRPATAPPPNGRPRTIIATACSRPTARSAGRGRTAGRRDAGCSRTTRISLMASLHSMRRRSTSDSFEIARRLMDRVLDAVRGSGRRLLRYRRRPRAAGDPAEGRPGQRRPVRATRWRRGSCCGSRHGRARLATAMPPSGRCGSVVPFVDAVPDRVRPVAVGDGPRPRARSSRSRSWARPTTRRRRRCWPRRGEGSARTRSSSVAAVSGRERRAAAARPGRHRRPADRLRLSRVRLPPAGDRRDGAARAARGGPGWLTEVRRVLDPRDPSPTNSRPSARSRSAPTPTC